jgi:putative heme iron utilization protein
MELTMSTTTASNFNAELAARVSEAFAKNPKQMTPTVARELGVAEAEVIRHLPNGASIELDISRWEEIIRRFEALEKVHVITNTGVVVLARASDERSALRVEPRPQRAASHG